MPWQIFRTAFLIASIAVDGRHFALGNLRLVLLKHERTVLPDVTFVIFHFPVDGLLRISRTHTTYKHMCHSTGEFSFHTPGVTLCPASDYHAGSLAFILIHDFSSLCACVCEAHTHRILRHATLPVRFPFWISRGTIGCGKPRDDIFSLLLAQGRISYSPRAANGLPLRTHRMGMVSLIVECCKPFQVPHMNPNMPRL